MDGPTWGAGHPQASGAGNKPMAEQEPLRASVTVVMSMPGRECGPRINRKPLWLWIRHAQLVALETSVPVHGVVLEHLRAKAMDKALAEQSALEGLQPWVRPHPLLQCG